MSKIRVFSDYHHEDLFFSLQLLFEQRLDWQLFRPVGLEWYEEGYWHVYNHIDTARQYLALDHRYQPSDGSLPLNPKFKEVSDNIGNWWEIDDFIHETKQKAVSLNQFKAMKFDIIIASIPAHIAPFKKLISLYQPQAKLIIQAGNHFNYNFTEFNNLMASANFINLPSHINYVSYHQEIPKVDFIPVTNPLMVRGYVHYFPRTNDYNFYQGLKKQLPEYTFESYGAGCENGPIGGFKKMIESVQGTGFGLHFKPGGDGFGHVIHTFFAVGRSPIVIKKYYSDKLAEPLLIDGDTCLVIDDKTVLEAEQYIRRFSKIEEVNRLGFNAYLRFQKIVNYDNEEIKIRKFLENLK